jgi:RNA polymerase sigma factor (sigma-70 family)
LPNFHDAEDACQAAFLVLARKAGSVRKKTSLSSWLHGVACRLALTVKRDHARRKSRERATDTPAPRDPAAEVTWREVQTILDEELHQLPERYRTPLILCYLECTTRDEAAGQLGLSPGSLHGRLQRARDMLRDRLAKRGLTLPAVMSAAVLGESVAQAALSPTFVVTSTKAALLLAAGKPLAESLIATNVFALTQEVLKSMFLTKLKLGTAIVLCAGLFAALIGPAFTSLGMAQDTKAALVYPVDDLLVVSQKPESDADFIRRISKDLRGTDPTPAEIHFFVANKDPGRRQKLIDLFIQERQAKTEAAAKDALALHRLALTRYRLALQGRAVLDQPPTLGRLQINFYKELTAAKEKGDVAKITQAYLDRLIEYVKAHPKNEDAPDAIRQIALVYESQGKTVEAAAWRDKLKKEYPKTSLEPVPDK